MISQKNLIIGGAILLVFIFWYRKRYSNCASVWKNHTEETKQIFFETINKVDNNSSLKKEIQKKAADNNISYYSQKVEYATNYMIEKKLINDLDKTAIMKCLSA